MILSITQCLDLNSKKRIRTVRELQRRLVKPSAKDYRPASPVQRSAATPEKKKESHAGLYILIILAIGLVIAIYASSGGNKNSGYSGGQYSQTSPKNSGSSGTNDDASYDCSKMLYNIKTGEEYYRIERYDNAYLYLNSGVNSLCYGHEPDKMRGVNILGKIYEKKKNYADAVKMYQRAVNGGYNPARYNLARCYRDGLGVAKNEQTAYNLFLEAAQKGDGDASVQVAFYCEKTGNNQYALGWYEDALKKGTNDKDIQIHIDRVKKKLLRTALN